MPLPEESSNPRLSRAIDSAETERRLAGLEAATKRLDEQFTERRLATLEENQKRQEITQTDRNLRTTSIVFGAMTLLIAATAVLVSFWTWGSRTETRQATEDMKQTVKEAVQDMEKRFDRLAGDALKKPSLQITCNQNPLDGGTIEAFLPRNVSPQSFTLDGFFLENTGDRRTGPLSISISVMGPLVLGWQHANWNMGPSPDRDYSVSFNSTRDNSTVAVKQKLNLYALELQWNGSPFGITNVPCKMQVYYDGERSAEARFQLKLIPK